MGNVDRLLDALVRKLPRTADEKAITAALRAAVQVLPASQAKTRNRVCQNEEQCVERVKAQLKATDDIAKEAIEGQHATSTDAAEESVPDAYGDLDSEDTRACINRCSLLMAQALSSLRPADRAQDALDGLLAILPPDASGPLEASVLAGCVRVVPAVSAALGQRESPAWRRFLGFLVSAAARLTDTPESEAVAMQLGSLIALSASPAAARAALRLGLVNVKSILDCPALVCLARIVLPTICTAFGHGAAPAREDVKRGDLLALLHGLRFVCLCQLGSKGTARASSSVSSSALAEARDILRIALECRFDAALLQPPLKRMIATSGAGKKKSHSFSAVAASAVVDSFDAVAADMTPTIIARLADCHGLPVGVEEEQDRVVVAKATGGLFFEDVAGDFMDAASAEAADETASSAAAEAVAAGAFERLDGVEALKSLRRKQGTSLKLKVNQVRQEPVQLLAPRRKGAKSKARRHRQKEELPDRATAKAKAEGGSKRRRTTQSA